MNSIDDVDRYGRGGDISDPFYTSNQDARKEARVDKFTVVANAAGMAAYEPGRAKPVSVLKATGTNVVVFAFDAGTGLREHVAQQPVLLQALEGTLTVEFGNEVVKLQQGDLLHIEQGVPHSVEAAERAKLQLMVLMIDSPGPSKIPMENYEHPERTSGN